MAGVDLACCASPAGVTAYGNIRSGWNAGCGYDFTDPECGDVVGAVFDDQLDPGSRTRLLEAFENYR